MTKPVDGSGTVRFKGAPAVSDGTSNASDSKTIDAFNKTKEKNKATPHPRELKRMASAAKIQETLANLVKDKK